MERYEYGVRTKLLAHKDDPGAPSSIVQSDLEYQHARDYADGWNATPGTTTWAEVVVRKITIDPWVTSMQERKLQAKTDRDAALDTLREQGKLDSKWFEV